MILADEVDSASVEDRRRATARRNAELQARRTVERLTAGIAALTTAGTPISAKTVERETGLSYRTITRNTAAYVLFCKHAAHFVAKPIAKSTKPNARARRKLSTPKAAPWEPLLGRSKRHLATRIRAAEQRTAELEEALAVTSAQHQELLGRNLALEAELAQTTRRLSQVIAEHRSGPA
jgi:hypothetical protein